MKRKTQSIFARHKCVTCENLHNNPKGYVDRLRGFLCKECARKMFEREIDYEDSFDTSNFGTEHDF